MLTEAEIKQLIAEDAGSEKKRLARIGQRYYEGDHDIKGRRLFYYNSDGVLTEDKTRSNERISHPFFTELVDQLTSYILSKPEEIITAEVEGLQEHLDEYFDDDFWAEAAELLTGVQVKGFDYLHAFKNEDDRLSFQYADGMGVIEIRERESDANPVKYLYYFIDRIERGQKEIVRIRVHDERQIYYYVQVDDTGEIVLDDEVMPNPMPNVVYRHKKTGQKFGRGFGFVPFFRLDYNRKQTSALKPIKALIDDYDLMQCGLSNNLQDFDTPIHVVKGYDGDNLDELQQNIKTKKVVGVGEGGGLEVMTVNVPYEARKTKADEDEKNIYRFGMGLDTRALKDTSATTNIAIKMAYTLLDLKAKKIEAAFKRFLRKIVRVVLDEINQKHGTGYQASDVSINFPHEINVNEQENAQIAYTEAQTEQMRVNTVLNVAEAIGDEETLKAICEIMELDFDEVRAKVKEERDAQSTESAESLLEGVVTEDESAGENRSGTIFAQ